jgi:hypothetical protein
MKDVFETPGNAKEEEPHFRKKSLKKPAPLPNICKILD